jgi:C-terminal processing protease CtpA/Prc
VSHDKHLGILYAPETIAMIKMAQENPEDDSYNEMQREQLRKNNYGFKEVKILPGNIGYIDFRMFAETATGSGETAIAAMQFLANTDAIIFDLRQNGGGSPSMIQLLTTYLYEGEPQHLNTFYWRPSDEYNQFWTLPHVPGKRMPDVNVYVLTSRSTFSGAEEFTYNLKNMERAIIVGEITGGGAHPVGQAIINDNFGIRIPMGKAINPITETNWEGVGISPHYEVPSADAYDKAYFLALDSLMKDQDNPEDLAGYQWIMDGLKAKIEPVVLTEKEARKCVGKYGPRDITYKNGHLYYTREDRPTRKMIPMSENLFMFDDIDYFRLEVVFENDEAVAVVGHYDSGRTDRHKRD